jgi:uncharacterized protein (DUF3820 family)
VLKYEEDVDLGNVIVPFGRYQGKKLCDVDCASLLIDLDWLRKNSSPEIGRFSRALENIVGAYLVPFADRYEEVVNLVNRYGFEVHGMKMKIIADEKQAHTHSMDKSFMEELKEI